MNTAYVITNLTKRSDTVVRVEGASVDGAVLVIDILTLLCADMAVGNTLQLSIGTHSLAYAINAQVVALGTHSLLASYGGLTIRMDGGLDAGQHGLNKDAHVKMSLSCTGASDSSKRPRIFE